MSAAHTPGRLIVGPGMHGTTKLLLSAPDGGHIAVAAYMTEADAERLAACWNACDGISDDVLRLGWNAVEVHSYAKAMENELSMAHSCIGMLNEQISKMKASGSHGGAVFRESRLDGTSPDTEGGSCD